MNNSADNKDKIFNIDPDNGSIVENNPDNKSSLIHEENGSFCRMGSDNGGILEVDLRVSKQRGAEVRHISISVLGVNESNEIGKTEMFLLDESQLKKLQAFIARLTWND